MSGWKMWFILLLPLTFCINREATSVKKPGEQFITPLCSNRTDRNNTITLIVCKIFKRSSGEECQLLYQYGKGFQHKCGSRFKLLSENQTVFLHLIKLTTEDSGNYTCQCTKFDGTYTLHLNITVEEDEDTSRPTEMQTLNILMVVTTVVIMTGVTVGLFNWTKSHRNCVRSAASGPSDCKTCSFVDQDDTYTSLLYQTTPTMDQDEPNDPYKSLLYQTTSTTVTYSHM